MKRVLVICSSFPPINATSIHRTLALVRRLVATDVRVAVLTMEPPDDSRIDTGLLARVPAEIQILRAPNIDLVGCVKQFFTSAFPTSRTRTPAQSNSDAPQLQQSGPTLVSAAPDRPLGNWRDWCTTWLQMPDNRVGWAMASMKRWLRPVRRFAPDVIYSTAPMWSCHVLGMTLAGLLKRPWVADCRDPWRANPYRSFASRLHDSVDAALERRMVSKAAAVVCNTPAVQRDFCSRYSRHAAKFTAIPNGFDPREIADALAQPAAVSDGLCRFVHAGVFYGPRSPQPFFEALALLVAAQPALRSRVRLRQVGLTHYNGRDLKAWAADCGVADMLELTGPLDHRAALRAVCQADVAIAASQDGENGHLQIPRKFYEYYGLGKAILVSGGSGHSIAELFDGRIPPGLWLVPRQQPQDLAKAMGEIIQAWQDKLLFCRRDGWADLSEDRMAADLERVLQQAAIGLDCRHHLVTHEG